MNTGTLSAARAVALLGGRPSGRPAYATLAEALRGLIVDGRISLGDRLPSERDLAVSLGASRTTVTRAYDVLRERGFVVSRRGSGSCAALPVPGGTSVTAGLLSPLDPGLDDVIDLTCAALRAPAGIEDAYRAALDDLPRHLAGAGYTTSGLPDLRAELARRYTERGLPTTPEQVLITSGAVSGILLVARALASAGQRVLVEDPTFPNTAIALRSAGLRLLAAPVEPTGWDVDHVCALVRRARPTLGVFIPDFHNPTGALMPDEQRQRLAAALAAASTTPIIDETMIEIALDESPRPAPFAAHARAAISVGSSSKSHWGGLRTGWIRTAGAVPDGLIAAGIAGDGGAALLEQLVLLHLLRSDRAGIDAARLADLRRARDATAAALRDRLPQARFELPAGGLSLWVDVPGCSAGTVALLARERGLLVAAGPRFAVGHGHGTRVRLPYVASPDVMRDAVARLADSVAAAQSATPRVEARRSAPLVA